MDASRTLRILTFSTLYPNEVQPRHGVFVEERLRHLVAGGGVSATVMAPIPWFPWTHPRFGRYARFATVPAEEIRHELKILHPRYPVLPKVGMSLAPALLARSMLPLLRQLEARGETFDLIDAHYFYPDGVAAVWLGQQLGKPVVVTARGTDVNWIPRYRMPRFQIQWAASRASRLVSVSSALAEHLVRLGVERQRITVLRNGVDLEKFQPQPAAGAALRSELGLDGPVLLSVGGLIERKGHHYTIEAMRHLPAANLLIAGEGPLGDSLRRQARESGVAERVHFLGPIAHEDLPRYYSAADVSVLASSREGMPNVVLESIACGVPVVACDVEGVKEVLATPEVGRVADRRDAAALATAVGELLRRRTSRETVRQYARSLSWEETSIGQLELFRACMRDAEAHHSEYAGERTPTGRR